MTRTAGCEECGVLATGTLLECHRAGSKHALENGDHRVYIQPVSLREAAVLELDFRLQRAAGGEVTIQ